MGNSNNGLANCTPPAALTAAQIQAIPLGGTMQINGCEACPATLYETCNNSLGAEWGNDSSQPSGAGCILQCSRTQYLNTDLSTCCLGQQSTNSQLTCNPATNNPNASGCTATLQSYCAGSNIFTNPTCTSWAAQNPTLAYDIEAAYCDAANIYSDPNCKAFAQSAAAQGKIDSTMSTYCSEYPTDALCACINSPMPSCPQQFDLKCRSGGYQTDAMMTESCPSVMDCNQYNILSPGAISVATNVTQNCSSTTNVTNTATGQTSSTTTGQTTKNGVTTPISASTVIPTATSYDWVYIMIAIFFIMLIIIVTAILLWPDDKSDIAYKTEYKQTVKN